MIARQYVTFILDTSLCGLPVEAVREVNRLIEVTPVQHVPYYIQGLMNLRGQIVTVFDLASRLHMKRARDKRPEHNIILHAEPVGLLVDDVGDVVNVQKNSVKPPPPHGSGMAFEFLDGVVEMPAALLLLLSSQRILDLTLTPDNA